MHAPARIYKSRNFLKLLGAISVRVILEIYKSRNFLKLLGPDFEQAVQIHLQE